MNIQSINNNYSYIYPCRTNVKPLVIFRSAKDISPQYVLKKHSKYLPERIQKDIIKRLQCGNKELPPLWEIHNEVYEALMRAKTLDEAKRLYPEFKDIIDITMFRNNRSKVIKTISEKIPLEEFTLEYLKRIYTPLNQQSIVGEFELPNRSSLDWLNIILNIKKLSGNYLNLLRMSNEEENNRIAECSRRAIFANPEAQKQRLEKAAEGHRTPEYREKKAKESRRFNREHPEHRENVGIISKYTWDKCPEIKEALSAYTQQSSDYVKSILSKRSKGIKLTEQEKRTLSGYYSRFWNDHPELKAIYRSRRIEVIEELLRKGIIKKKNS